MTTLQATCSRRMDCPRGIVIWNYFDCEHVTGTHYKHYNNTRVVAEREDWNLSERFFKLPIIGYQSSSYGFMHLENPQRIRSFQFGKLGMVLDQTIDIVDDGPDRCVVTSHYTLLNVPIFAKPFEPLFRRIIQKWFDNTWDEDAPMRLRRHRVWQLGFEDFKGIDHINRKTAKPSAHPDETRAYPIELPVPKSTPITKSGWPRPFDRSVELGYRE